MRALADALVYAVAYISALPDEREEFLHYDVRALESIAAYLNGASRAEQDELAEAAERAFASERNAGQPLGAFAAALQNWMENVFGPPWEGNRRT
jgi:hypothetical protein